ncbi:HLH-domain-containing protein [Laetiporus sulphureus 93-53]|uniref:HLH-domain-containing protein n=1 Tax=Laetiporus sulphureus 93-53 TaxID=1314785 RepID=A0A165EYE8_9APHY|nr:HLH-domain-containing protein [Laetiporus sulphureus 93-53]KZT07979.1 HLH-domain-containing protein [Laetiporus sulphureus 93-53]
MASTTFFAASYKPQVLSRQEGFHLPSPAPSNGNPPSPPSSNGTPVNNGSAPSAANNFDPTGLFLSPFLNVHDTFRKFPTAADTAATMDFGDELASLIGSDHAHGQSNERSTQNGNGNAHTNGNANGYDDYRSTTHNIFDISAPTSHHHHHQHHHSSSTSQQQQQQPHSPFGQNAFSLPPASALHTNGALHSPSSLGHDFSTHFNSTVPAIGSSMRYEPPPAPFGMPNHPGGQGAEPSSVSSFNSHLSSLSGISSFSGMTTTSPSADLLAHHAPHGQQRQTPSPVSPSAPEFEFSRSRSRSTTRNMGAVDPNPSTNGGPARRTRAKRGSVSSVSPPPLHRGHTQPLVIPGAGMGRGPASPLSLHSSGWFGGAGEFSLPTPDSVHGGFSAFGGGSMGSVGLGVSPKDMGMGAMMGGAKGGESPPGDMATKQAIIANEKRRRRRESHNAVERRRRDNINEKISELATLIPECLLDPSATLTMPTSLASATGEDLLFGTAGVDKEKKEKKDEKEKKEEDESAEPEEKDKDGGANAGEQGGVVKANKGMILRKSVEYIRYLQQLVSAQASRNRDLEQQLQVFRGKDGVGAGECDEEGRLVLHEEVGDFLGFASAAQAQVSMLQNGRRKKSFTELESVEEDMDTEMMEDGDMDGDGEKSPSVSEDGEEGEEEERGRKGRDGRPVGVGVGAVSMKKEVSVKEEADAKMETS